MKTRKNLKLCMDLRLGQSEHTLKSVKLFMCVRHVCFPLMINREGPIGINVCWGHDFKILRYVGVMNTCSTYDLFHTSSNTRLRPGDSLIAQIIDLQTLFAINDRQTGQTESKNAFDGWRGRGGVARSRTVCIENR